MALAVFPITKSLSTQSVERNASQSIDWKIDWDKVFGPLLDFWGICCWEQVVKVKWERGQTPLIYLLKCQNWLTECIPFYWWHLCVWDWGSNTHQVTEGHIFSSVFLSFLSFWQQKSALWVTLFICLLGNRIALKPAWFKGWWGCPR